MESPNITARQLIIDEMVRQGLTQAHTRSLGRKTFYLFQEQEPSASGPPKTIYKIAYRGNVDM